MLKAYLEAQLDRALRNEITNGLRHCHAKGLYSIVFHDEPGNRVRMFVAGDEHDLHRNELQTTSRTPMTLAIHPHHCDLRFVRIFGQPENHVYRVMGDDNGKLHEMVYKSGITGTTGSLTPTGFKFTPIRTSKALIGDNTVMRADELHTIVVPYATSAAWLVIEGRNDPDYKSVCYTNDPKPDMTGLYEPMTTPQIAATINTALRGHHAEQFRTRD